MTSSEPTRETPIDPDPDPRPEAGAGAPEVPHEAETETEAGVDTGVEAEGPGATGPPRPSLRAVGGWLLLVGVAVALDGLAGGLTLVVIAAVLLAGLSPRLIGGLGVLLLLATPVAIVIDGVPTSREISPAFVTRSLVPHHLTFAGLVLVSAFALIDLAPHLRDWAAAERPAPDDGPPLGVAVGIGVVVVVAVGALLACWAVIGA